MFPCQQLNVNAIATPDVATQAYESAPGPSALYPENDDTTCANRSPNVTSSTAELAQNADLQAGEIATSTTDTHQNNVSFITASSTLYIFILMLFRLRAQVLLSTIYPKS